MNHEYLRGGPIMAAENFSSTMQPVAIKKLWTPGTIGLMSAFLGFPSGVILASINWMRMGFKEKAIIHILAGMMLLWAMVAFSDNIRTGLVVLINVGIALYFNWAMQKDIGGLDAAGIQYSRWISGLGISLAGWGILLIAFYGFSYLEGLMPGTSLYHTNRGDEYSNNGNYDLAVAEFSKAIELETNQDKLAILYYYRGLASYKNGDLQGSIADCSKVLQIIPSEGRALLLRGVAYSSNDEYGLAVTDFTQAIQINTQDSIAYYNRGNAYEKLGEFKNAILDFSQVIKMDPNDWQAFSHRGLNRALNGEYELAVDDFSQAIKINPEDADDYFNRGLAFEKLGMPDQAIHDFERVLELTTDPNLKNGAEKELLKLKGNNLQ